jgi:dihydrodipicolinate synthase/N-acetylneuraminate lyase
MTNPINRTLPRGAGVALVTLFDSDGNVLTKRTAELAVAITEAGASSVLVAGTVGEYYLLTRDERVSLFAAVRAALPAHIPVVAHVGGVPQAEAVELTKRAVAAGADVLLALPKEVRDVKGYYAAILDSSDPIPVLAYHLPQAGGNVDIETLASLGVNGIKDSSGEGERFVHEVLGMNIPTYTGAISLVGLAHDLGAAGALLGAANIWPELCARALSGDRAAQKEVAANSLSVKSSFPGALKRATSARWNVSPLSR